MQLIKRSSHIKFFEEKLSHMALLECLKAGAKKILVGKNNKLNGLFFL